MQILSQSYPPSALVQPHWKLECCTQQEEGGLGGFRDEKGFKSPYTSTSNPLSKRSPWTYTSNLLAQVRGEKGSEKGYKILCHHHCQVYPILLSPHPITPVSLPNFVPLLPLLHPPSLLLPFLLTYLLQQVAGESAMHVGMLQCSCQHTILCSSTPPEHLLQLVLTASQHWSVSGRGAPQQLDPDSTTRPSYILEQFTLLQIALYRLCFTSVCHSPAPPPNCW